MRVSQLWTYPIKSLRGTPLKEGILTKHGFPYDRRFMLCKAHESSGSTFAAGIQYKNMHIPHFPEMALFRTEIVIPDPEDLVSAKVVVTFKSPYSPGPQILEIPLKPETAGLETVDVVMHKSGTKAYNMGAAYNDWFSSCFGFNVILVYLGEHLRDVLCSNPGSVQPAASWLASVAGIVPFLGASEARKDQITFADCVPYLVVSDTSVQEVSSRLPDGENMDVRKFRPNIVIEGASEAWEEDYWAELQVGDAKIITAHNCLRCSSLNINYSTGKIADGETGQVLKKLQKDRRVDPGMKYSPVFGRYSFLGSADDGKVVKIGDEVNVLKRNPERTVFDWEGLTA